MDGSTQDALKRVVQARIDQENFGMMTSSRPRDSDLIFLRHAGIEVSGDTIKENGRPIMRIVHRYAAKKQNGMYKELTPRFAPITDTAASE